MRIKTLVSAIAIALAAAVGSAHAAEKFPALEAVSAQPMSSAELDSVRGQGTLHLILSLFECECSATIFHKDFTNNVNAATTTDLTIFIVGNHAGSDEFPPPDEQRHGAHVFPSDHGDPGELFRGHTIP